MQRDSPKGSASIDQHDATKDCSSAIDPGTPAFWPDAGTTATGRDGRNCTRREFEAPLSGRGRSNACEVGNQPEARQPWLAKMWARFRRPRTHSGSGASLPLVEIGRAIDVVARAAMLAPSSAAVNRPRPAGRRWHRQGPDCAGRERTRDLRSSLAPLLAPYRAMACEAFPSGTSRTIRFLCTV